MLSCPTKFGSERYLTVRPGARFELHANNGEVCTKVGKMSVGSKATSPCAGGSTTRPTIGPFEEQSGFSAVICPITHSSPDGTKRVTGIGLGKAGVGGGS